MSYLTMIAGIFKKFKYALGWFLIKLLGLTSSSLLIFFILWTLYTIYSLITNTSPLKIFDISTDEDNKVTMKIEFLILSYLGLFLIGIMFGFIYKK